mgnify:CR=1 FL=1
MPRYTSDVLLLALETTSHHGSAALLRDGVVLQTIPLDARLYSTQLWGGMDALLAAAGMKRDALEAIAVAHGPGSFTGVRLGLTTAKALVEARGLAAISISTLVAVAAQGASSDNDRGPIVAVLDASRDECYLGLYPHGPLQFARDPTGESEGEPAELLLPVAAAEARLRSLNWPVWTQNPALAERLRLGRSASTFLASPLLAPWIGQLGDRLLREGQRLDALRLDANYIRRSDAELFRKI